MRPVLFYSQWPLGYHNPEAERKARALAREGREVVYVTGVGIRNPRPSSAAKLVDRAARKLGRGGARPDTALRTAALAVVPPRQLALARRLNVAWVERQLRGVVGDWGAWTAWVRWPTPELVAALPALGPAAVVYDCVDAYRHTPGITGRWVEIFDRAERDLAVLADVVVVPGEALADHARAIGAKDVRVVPHGVDLFDWREPEAPAGNPTAGFVGTLDYRLDLEVIEHLSGALPEWSFRFIGPAQEGFDRARISALPNVAVEPAIPHERLGATLAELDVGLMPYRADPVFEYMSPLKSLELMAAGRPAVARPSRALEEHADLLYFAESPTEFEAQLRRAVADDTPDLARRRRAVAEASGWEGRLAEHTRIVEELESRSG